VWLLRQSFMGNCLRQVPIFWPRSPFSGKGPLKKGVMHIGIWRNESWDNLLEDIWNLFCYNFIFYIYLLCLKSSPSMLLSRRLNPDLKLNHWQQCEQNSYSLCQNKSGVLQRGRMACIWGNESWACIWRNE